MSTPLARTRPHTIWRIALAMVGIAVLNRCGDANSPTTSTGNLSEAIAVTSTTDAAITTVAPGTSVKITYQAINHGNEAVVLTRPNNALADLQATDGSGWTVASLVGATAVTTFTVPAQGTLSQPWTWTQAADVGGYVPAGTYQFTVVQANTGTPPTPGQIIIQDQGLIGALTVVDAGSNAPVTSVPAGTPVRIDYVVTNPSIVQAVAITSTIGLCATLVVRQAAAPHTVVYPLPPSVTGSSTILFAPGQSRTVTMTWNGRDTAGSLVPAGSYILEAANYFPGGPAKRIPLAITAPTSPSAVQ